MRILDRHESGMRSRLNMRFLYEPTGVASLPILSPLRLEVEDWIEHYLFNTVSLASDSSSG